MKITNKKIGLIAGIVFAIGLVLFIIGIALGGVTSATINSKGLSFTKFSSKNKETVIKLEEFNSINIDTSFTELEIIKSDNNRAVIYSSESNVPTVNIKNDTLQVKSTSNSFAIEFLNFNVKALKIKLYVNNEMIKKMVIQNSFGSVTSNEINVEKVEIDNNFGDTVVKNINKELRINNSFGNVKVNTNNLELINIDNSFGTVTSKINDSEINYDIDSSDSFGEIYTVNEVNGKLSEYRDIKSDVYIDSSFGEVKLVFLKR